MSRNIAWIAIAAMAVGACATKKHVSNEVGEVNRKVEGLSEELEKTQDRVGRNEERMEGLDQSVADARDLGNAAMTRATAAESRASEAERIARGKLIYTVTLSNDKVTFPFNHAELSDEAKAMVDDSIGGILSENRGVYFEVEGHTDSVGEEEYNHTLGLERAEAVRQYLYLQHKVALNRIEVISFGESQPVTDNDSRDSRAKNRRVVIKVLE